MGKFIALVLAICAILGVAAFFGAYVIEVDSYTTTCEISKIEWESYKANDIYKIGIRNNEIAETFDISQKEFAKYCVGDIVEIKVTTFRNRLGDMLDRYTIIGLWEK